MIKFNALQALSFLKNVTDFHIYLLGRNSTNQESVISENFRDYNAGQKTLGHLRKYYAMRQTFEETNYLPFPAPPGYMHTNQRCIGGGEREVTTKTICGEKVKCPKTSDHNGVNSIKLLQV